MITYAHIQLDKAVTPCGFSFSLLSLNLLRVKTTTKTSARLRQEKNEKDDYDDGEK
jgi:hypothetical protein